MTFYADPKLRYFDVDITLTALATVTFGDGKDGAFGIRLRPVLQEDKGVSHITNAEGLVGEKQLWASLRIGAIIPARSLARRSASPSSITPGTRATRCAGTPAPTVSSPPTRSVFPHSRMTKRRTAR